ncbi:MAG: tRNA pseudouridine(38-40) synthase TruA [Deltaproteobacteria bacterium]
MSEQVISSTHSPNILLKIEYDGTDFCGWQRQPDGPTIQSTIEDFLQSVLQRRVVLYASGRTDSGVHALSQYAMFRGDVRYEPQVWAKMLNFNLPPSIRILESRLMPDDFHAQKDVLSKTYEYRILNRKVASAINRGVHFYPGKLDWDKIREALVCFIGEKDFKSFQGAKAEVQTTIRTIFRFELLQLAEDFYAFQVEGNGFLKHMVRTMVGTLLEVGEGKFKPSEVSEIIASRDRRRAGRTVPPSGLYLAKVVYPERYGLN